MRGEIEIFLVSVQLTQKSAQLSCTGFIRNSLATKHVGLPGCACECARRSLCVCLSVNVFVRLLHSLLVSLATSFKRTHVHSLNIEPTLCI